MTNQQCHFCPTCKQRVSFRKVLFSSTLVAALAKAFVHAQRKGSRIIHINELRLTPVEYTRMNYLVRFGLAYREDENKKGVYGLPMKRIAEFFRGEWMVSEYYWQDPITGERIRSENRITVFQVKKVSDIIAEYGDTLTDYKENEVQSSRQKIVREESPSNQTSIFPSFNLIPQHA